MDQFGAADRRRLLAFLRESEEVPLLNLNSAREFVLRGLSALVPSDCAVHHFWDEKLGRLITTMTEPEVQATRDSGEDLWLAISARGEHPIVTYWNRTGDHHAVRLSDVIDQAALHQLEIYDHFWRPHAIERTMGARVQISSRYLVDLACYRSGSDFSERDRAVLDEIRVYVGPIVRRAEVSGLVNASVAALGLTRREAEIIAWVTRGKTNVEIGTLLFLAPGTVKKHLDNVYRKLSIRTRTEAAAMTLAVSWGAATPIEPDALNDRSLTSLGLTRREADVLVLAARGKTNAEIGTILVVAAGTAKLHLENAYRKLEVNTRTEAATLALTAMSGHRTH